MRERPTTHPSGPASIAGQTHFPELSPEAARDEQREAYLRKLQGNPPTTPAREKR